MKSRFIEFKAAEKNGMQFFYFNLINKEEKEYSLIIKVLDGKVLSSNCGCFFGSYYKFSKKNLEMDKNCYHINEAISILKLMGYVYDEETRIIEEQEDTVTTI